MPSIKSNENQRMCEQFHPEDLDPGRWRLDVKALIDKYGEASLSAYGAARIVLVISVLCATISRSPNWIVKLKEIFGISLEVGSGLTGGMMPIFGPVVVYLLYLRFHTA